MTATFFFDVAFHAMAVAASPEAIFSGILVLLTHRAQFNSGAYLLGWLTGLIAVFAVVLSFDDTIAGGRGGMPKSDLAGILRVGFGALLLLLAVRRILKRRRRGHAPYEPKWLAVVERFGPRRCFVWGFLLAGLNPKNIALTATGAVHLSLYARSLSSEIVGVVVFLLLASSTVAAPFALYLALGARAEPHLQRIRGWFARNNEAVIVMLFLIFGIKLIGDGVANLAY